MWREDTSTVATLTSNPALPMTSAAVRVRLAAVGEHDVLADANAAGDSLTDLAGSDDNDDVLHAVLPGSV